MTKPRPAFRALRLPALLVCCGAALAPAKAEESTRGVHLYRPEGSGAAQDQKNGGEAPLPLSPRLANDAQLTLTISPSADDRIGDKLAFRVSAKKNGYLLLIDMDAEGHVTQIFPNFLSVASGAAEADGNRLAANAPVLIPAEGSKLYEFVASAPPGVGMAFAIFSEAPIQMVDLPDAPPELAGKPEAAEFLRMEADALQIVSPDPGGGFQRPHFSYVAQFYRIR